MPTPNDGRPVQREPFVRLLLDSGAYSARQSGQQIDVAAYIDYVKSVAHLCHSYVNLDVIAEAHRREALEAAARASRENLQRMKAAGLRPIPVFHYGERFEWLDRMLRDGETYIGVAARKGFPNEDVLWWMDRAFDRLTDAGVRTHGFGITRFELLARYPFTTVDSTSWSLNAGYGRIWVPRLRGAEPAWDCAPMIVTISGKKQKRPIRMQFEYMTPNSRAVVLRWLDECGVTLDEARCDASVRRRLILRYFQKRSGATRIVFATTPNNRTFSDALTEAKVRDRLVSYWYSMNWPLAKLDYWVKTGVVPD